MSRFKPQLIQRALVVEDDFWMEPLISMALRGAVPGMMIDWVDTAEEALRKTRYWTCYKVFQVEK